MKKNLIDLFVILLAFVQITSCSKNSTEPVETGESSVSVTGDVTEAYDVFAYFGISTYTSDMEDLEYFTIMLLPGSEENPLAMTLLYKSGAETAETGSYQIGKYSFGNDIPEDDFGASFSPLNTDELSGYIMTSGTLTISKSSSESVRGSFDMSGYFAQFTEEDETRIINISGKFNAIPMSEINP